MYGALILNFALSAIMADIRGGGIVSVISCGVLVQTNDMVKTAVLGAWLYPNSQKLALLAVQYITIISALI